MKVSGYFWWVAACVSAVMAGLLTYSLLRPAASVATAPAVTTRSVVVAAVNIPLRRSITSADVALRDLPENMIPAGAAVSLEQVVGKMSTVDLFANEPVLSQQMVTPDVVTQQVALSIPRGKILMAVPTQSRLIRNDLVRPGDRIDLLATVQLEPVGQQGGNPRAETVVLLQDLQVHAIILPLAPVTNNEITSPTDPAIQQEQGGVFHTADENGQSLLLALDVQDALTVRHVLDIDGLLDLALRAPDDDSAFDSEAVDQFYLAQRYKLNLNR